MDKFTQTSNKKTLKKTIDWYNKFSFCEFN